MNPHSHAGAADNPPSAFTLEEYADVLAHWLQDERVPAFVRAMVEAEWRAAKAQQAKRGKVVERDHLADMLGRLRRALPGGGEPAQQREPSA